MGLVQVSCFGFGVALSSGFRLLVLLIVTFDVGYCFEVQPNYGSRPADSAQNWITVVFVLSFSCPGGSLEVQLRWRFVVSWFCSCLEWLSLSEGDILSLATRVSLSRRFQAYAFRAPFSLCRLLCLGCPLKWNQLTRKGLSTNTHKHKHTNIHKHTNTRTH